MVKIRAIVFFICLIVVVFCREEQNKIFHVSLNGDNSVSLHWTINYNTEYLIFEIHIPSNFSWFAFGFSDRGKLFPADYCLLSKNLNGKISLQDTHADETGILLVDQSQDCESFKIKNFGETTKFTFKRKFDTCDKFDYIIEDGTTHIVWARGHHNLYQIKGLNISSPIGDSGMIRVGLLKNLQANKELPTYVKKFDILTDKVTVPDDETTYWCRVFKLPEEYIKTKHHIYQYESNVQKSSEGFVHHMEVFHCETDSKDEIPLYAGSCFSNERPQKTQVCKRVLAAWAMGAPPFVYPEEAALPIGGENFNPYIMLEVHYNNPEHISGHIDSSGIRFFVSNKLRNKDAGVIELGLEYTDKMAIPPKQDSFRLTGYCTSGCTAMSLPPEGIIIFGSQLHTHLTGLKVQTRHFDEFGRELPELNRDDHFSTHFQEIRRLKRPVRVLPGHILITRCDYNTEDRENITLGGFGITDEMCVNYIHYYPHTDLEVCKSSISDQALQTFFRYMKEWEGQETSPSKGVSDNYKAIKWNKMRVQLLDEVYNESPLSMQCNMSSGDRFPGYWENVPIPPIFEHLGPHGRKCENIL